MQPRAVYNSIWAVTGLAFGMVSTIGAVYRVREAGLDPFELVLVGTMLELSILVFEVPTGVVADVVSRRLSIIVGLFIVGAGFVLEGSVPELWAVLSAQLVWGFGYTFISGANTAWLADELGDDDLLAPALLRGTQWYQASLLAGIGLGALLAVIDLQVPIVAGGAAFLALGVVLALRMEEHGFAPAPRESRTTFAAFFRTFGEGVAVVRGRTVLLLLLGVAAFGGASSETVDRLWQVRFLDDFDIDAVIWFGALNGAWAVVGITGSEIVRRRGTGAASLLVILEVVRLGGLFLFALVGRLDLAVVG
ncbi:MAG: MFS transporter, partial [Actinomycetota bacterium]